MRCIATSLIAVTVLTLPLAAQDWRRDGVSEQRTERVPVGSANLVSVEAGAGTLRIVGERGLTDVIVEATLRASSRERLRSIELRAERVGARIEIIGDENDDRRHDHDEDEWHAVDLVIRVPAGMPLNVEDGSGDAEIRGTGSLRLVDGSGSLRLEEIGGDVQVRDGSGEILAVGIRGEFVIEEDGSGEIDVREVTGSVRVRSDGSGEISVTRVGGDFTVEHKGSGEIRSSEVRGEVVVPERRNRSGRRGRDSWRR